MAWIFADGPRHYAAHAVNGRNEVTQVTFDGAGGTEYAAPRYDAWNRLLQVNRAIDVGSNQPLQIGKLVKHKVYDGLGRLIRAQSPYPNPDASGGYLRSEWLFYDGIRRIQELVRDPVISVDEAKASNDPELVALAEAAGPAQDADDSTANIEFEKAAAPAASTVLAREYVWGPGDGHAGSDELLVQYASPWSREKPWFVLQDGGGDVAAVCDQASAGSAARVCAQYTWDAYGNVPTFDNILAHPYLHAGHKGLFVERLDAGVLTLGAETPRLSPYAKVLYRAGNRTYDPQYGRWMQRDPNATAMALIAASPYHGRGLDAIVVAFSVEEMYGDGSNLYEYLGSNPWLRSDPLGLSWDPFSMVDDFVNEHCGSAAAFLSQLGQHIKAAAVVAATIASYLPFPAANIAGELALAALGEKSWDEAMASIAMGLVPGSKIFSALKKSQAVTVAVGGIGSSAFSAAGHYAAISSGVPASKSAGIAATATALATKAAQGAFVRHHLLPRAFRSKFQKAGIDIEKYVVKVDPDWHKAIHVGHDAPGEIHVWELERILEELLGRVSERGADHARESFGSTSGGIPQ
jgi:hypothetical protein